MSFRHIATSAKIAIRVILLLALSGLAMAADSGTQIVARVVGEITVNANGSVKAVSLTNVKDAKFGLFLTEKVKSWVFYPMQINGKPVESTNEFSFDVIATTGPNNTLKKIQLNDVTIEMSVLEADINKKRKFKVKRQPAISYPTEALYGVEAKIIVAVDITADGKVDNVAVTDIEIMNTDNEIAMKLSNGFRRNALQGIRKWTWTPEQLVQNNCINGCVGLVKINFVMDKNGFWKIYQHVPQAPIPWVIASELKDMDDSEKSQLVRLKDDPTGKPIDMGS